MKLKGYEDAEVLWSDKKRYFGMPISFTKYALVRKAGLYTKLLCIKGLLSTHVEEIHAYRIDDVGCFQSLADKIFGVGSIDVYCKDASCDVLHILKVKDAFKVKSQIADIVEEEKMLKGMKYAEMSSSYDYK